MVTGLGRSYFFAVRIAKRSKNTKKNFGIEIFLSQPIFVVLGRELLPKFSNMTKIFSNSNDGLPALAPWALDGSPTLAPSALTGLHALPPPLALAFKI